VSSGSVHVLWATRKKVKPPNTGGVTEKPPPPRGTVTLCNTRPLPSPLPVHSLLPLPVPLYYSKSGRTFVRSPTSSAILRPSTVR